MAVIREKQYVDYRESHKGRGADYEVTFADIPHRKMIWRLETRFLTDVLRNHFPKGDVNYLDFACGTGRLLAFMEPLVRSATGIDVAQSMLDVCKSKIRSARIVCGDLTDGYTLSGAPFDLVTAFRFFPNAEPSLRAQVFSALSKATAPNGLLVFNNHMNRSSSAFRLLRLFGKPYGFEGVSDSELLAAASRAGFELEQTYHCGALPVIDEINVLPEWLLYATESLVSRISLLRELSSDVVFVCRRTAT